MVPGLQVLSYEARLTDLGIWSLEGRRNRADLIDVYKILKGFTSIDPSGLFEVNTDTTTRGHTLKLVKHRCSSDLRKYFFTERVVNRWNGLGQWSWSPSLTYLIGLSVEFRSYDVTGT